MDNNKNNQVDIDILAAELTRAQKRSNFLRSLRQTVFTLFVVASLAILAATLWMPVLEIYGSSMSPTLEEGQIVISVKSPRFERGDLVAFYLGNQVLVKRVIGCPSDIVDIDAAGSVSVNGTQLSEPYVLDKSRGECNILLPYQVPESRYFLMGDHRSTSIDSRNSTIGCIPKEQIVGKIVFRIWPLSDFGSINR